MFCPVCKTEYREGFMRCSDCGGALVTSLPAEPDLDPGSAEVLWAGIDPNTFAAIKAALQGADIPFQETGQSSPIIYASLRQPYEIWTYKRDHDAAQCVLDSVFREASPEPEPVADQGEENEQDNSGELADALPDELPGPVADDLIENFHPDDATSEVWSGEEAAMAEFLKDSLQANGIGCAIRDAGLDKHRVCVKPSDGSRAREIIRQVLDASPPQ